MITPGIAVVTPEQEHGDDERVVEQLGAELGRAGLVEVGGGDLRAVGGQREHAGEPARPHAR